MPNRARYQRYRFDSTRAVRAARSAETLAGVLHEVGLTHRDVGHLLGVSLYTVDSWTRAVDPKIPGEANLEKLCALLDSRVAGLGKKVASAAGAKRAAPPVSPPAPAPTAERNLKLVASDTQAPTPA